MSYFSLSLPPYPLPSDPPCQMPIYHLCKKALTSDIARKLFVSVWPNCHFKWLYAVTKLCTAGHKSNICNKVGNSLLLILILGGWCNGYFFWRLVQGTYFLEVYATDVTSRPRFPTTSGLPQLFLTHSLPPKLFHKSISHHEIQCLTKLGETNGWLSE